MSRELWALVDVNAAYVAFTTLFNPHIVDRPLGVLSSNQGNIIARNDAMKALGIKMGEVAYKVERLIRQNGGLLWGPNWALIGDMSDRFHTELQCLLAEPERYSVDEAFGLVPASVWPNALNHARHIQKTIKRNLGLPVGVGMGRTRVLAKAANWASKNRRWREKTRGVVVLEAERQEDWLLERMPVGEIWGVGGRLAVKLACRGIVTAADLRAADNVALRRELGGPVERLVLELRGISAISMQDDTEPREQICVSRAMGKLVSDKNELWEAVASHLAAAAGKLRAQGSVARLVTVFITTNPFNPNAKQYSNTLTVALPSPASDTATLRNAAASAFGRIFRSGFKFHKAGVILGGVSDGAQMDLFADLQSGKAAQVLDAINDKFGRGTLRVAAEGINQAWRPKSDLAPPSYTTSFDCIPLVKA